MSSNARASAKRWTCALGLAFVVASAFAQEDDAGKEQPARPPQTVPERSLYVETSTQADVLAFLEQLRALPCAARLRSESVGTSVEGRELTLVTVADPLPEPGTELDDPRLRLLVNANIHAGEVEGKEAVQAILRELALGQHASLLKHAILYFVPIYNVDGNERIDAHNRASQNGPAGGVGIRPNAQELDLNRDFVKVESPECRALMGLFRRLDPHLFMDLHTTNGSFHGYHLTYSPSLSTNVEPALDRFSREELLPAVTEAVGAEGWRIEHYGNFQAGEPRRWVTYDHRPRFGTNYYGLRNRIGVLSEAYSYLDFRPRIEVTRSFVLATLAACVERRDAIRELCAAADAQTSKAEPTWTFGVDSELAPPVRREILVGRVRRVTVPSQGRRPAERREALPFHEPEEMDVQVAFHSQRALTPPNAWAILDPSEAVVQRLDDHGLEWSRLEAPREVRAGRFVPSELRRARRPFQGHHELALSGDWTRATISLPAGTAWIPARQRLARVAAQLLEPESEDSLSTWNFFEAQTRATDADVAGEYPVLRVR